MAKWTYEQLVELVMRMNEEFVPGGCEDFFDWGTGKAPTPCTCADPRCEAKFWLRWEDAIPDLSAFGAYASGVAGSVTFEILEEMFKRGASAVEVAGPNVTYLGCLPGRARDAVAE